MSLVDKSNCVFGDDLQQVVKLAATYGGIMVKQSVRIPARKAERFSVIYGGDTAAKPAPI